MTLSEAKSIAVVRLPVIILLLLGWLLGGVTAFTLQSGAATTFPDSQIESPAPALGVQGAQLARAEVVATTLDKTSDAGRSDGLVMPGALLLGRGVGRIWR